MKKEAYWRGQVAALEQSGLSAAEYCRRQGIREGQIFYWRSRLGKKAAFARVGVGLSIEIELASGARLKLPVDLPAERFKAVLEAVGALGS